MRSSLSLFVLTILLVSFVTGCAPIANQSSGIANENQAVAGFWHGLWHGFTAPFLFVISLFKSSVGIYEVHNNGGWYNFGYLFGLACFFGGGGHGAARRK